MTVKRKFSQQKFDHMRSLIQKVKDRASSQHDLHTVNGCEMLDSLVVLFVEELLMDGRIELLPLKAVRQT